MFYKENLTNKFFLPINQYRSQNTKVDIMIPEQLKTFLVFGSILDIYKENEINLIEFIESFAMKIKNSDYVKNTQIGLNSLVIYIPSDLNYLKSVIEIMNDFCVRNHNSFQIYFLVYPKVNYLQEIAIGQLSNQFLMRNLKKERGEIIIENFNYDLFPLDEDLFSLELKQTCKSLYIDDSFEVQNLMAEQLFKFQVIFGQFQNVIALGEKAEQVVKISQQISKRNSQYLQKKFPSCIVFDRAVDFLSVLINQFSYTGMLDQFLRINLNAINIPKSLIDEKASSEDQISFDLFTHSFFNEIKNFTFKEMVEKLKLIGQEIEEARKNLSNLAKEKDNIKKIVSLSQFRKIHAHLLNKVQDVFLDPLNKNQSFFQLFTLSENDENEIQNEIIEMIQIQLDIKIVLNCIITANLVLKGFKENFFQQISDEFLKNYGINNLQILLKLQQSGFFIQRNNLEHSFKILKEFDYQKLKIFYPPVKLNPEREIDILEIGKFYYNYVPILMNILFSMFLPDEEPLKVSNWKFFDNFSFEHLRESKEILVCFVGGVTNSEICCIRKIGTFFKINFKILTSDVTNMNSLIEDLVSNQIY